MIEILTLFLGLVTGPAVVELEVGPAPMAVVAVEVQLDGEPVGRRAAPPWRFPVDFGAELAPHRLVAVALAGDGSELARAEQVVNVPRPPAEARLVFHGGRAGSPRRAGVVWDVLWPAKLDGVTVTLDGEEMEVDDPSSFALPDLDPHELHLLSVELAFQGGLRATAEASFGGAFGERVETELTAVPVFAGEAKRLRAESLAGRFRAAGAPLRVVAVEHSGADVVLVRDRRAQEHLVELVSAAEGAYRRLQRRGPRDLLPLDGPDRLRLVWPVLAATGTSPAIGLSPDLFSQAVSGWGVDTVRVLTEGEPPPLPERIADAVAVAARMAASGNRPRAVVLVADPATPDSSRHDAVRVRRYLERLRVPLEVWSTTGGPLPGWGPARPVGEWGDLQDAVRHLKQRLRSQTVVWLEGDHLAVEVELAAGGDRLTLAGAAEAAAGSDPLGVEP